jgi:hypothetical protein
MHNTTASNHVYLTITDAIGLCKICNRVIYKEDLVDKATSLDTIENGVVKHGKNEYLCLKHKGVKEMYLPKKEN